MQCDYGGTARSLCMHLLLFRVTQTGAPNQFFSRCQRHGYEEFEAISSPRTHIQQRKRSDFRSARISRQILYVRLSTKRPKMTFAAAIIHFGTFYPGTKRVGKLKTMICTGSTDLNESGNHEKKNINGYSSQQGLGVA